MKCILADYNPDNMATTGFLITWPERSKNSWHHYQLQNSNFWDKKEQSGNSWAGLVWETPMHIFSGLQNMEENPDLETAIRFLLDLKCTVFGPAVIIHAWLWYSTNATDWIWVNRRVIKQAAVSIKKMTSAILPKGVKQWILSLSIRLLASTLKDKKQHSLFLQRRKHSVIPSTSLEATYRTITQLWTSSFLYIDIAYETWTWPRYCHTSH